MADISERRSHMVNHLKPALIQFPDGNARPMLQVPQSVSAEQIVGALALPRPHAVLVLNGGTANLEPPLKLHLSRLMQDGVARIAAADKIMLVTGGTDAGLFALLGQGISKWGSITPCIGVAVEALTIRPGHPEGEASLEPHHSHFVLVEGARWGDETATMYALVAALTQDCPAIAVFGGGGEVVIQEMQANVVQDREMILLAGSGRTTDAVVAVREGQQTQDARLSEIARMGKIMRFDIHQEPAVLSDLIHRSLFDHREGR